MFNEINRESKSSKLAAARQKLKEYQQRNSIGIANVVTAQAKVNLNANESTLSSGQMLSSTSERPLSECQLNGNNNNIEVVSTNLCDNGNANEFKIQGNEFKNQSNESDVAQTVTASTTNNTTTTSTAVRMDNSVKCVTPTLSNSEAITKQQADTIQVLINEKHILTAELSKYRSTYQDKELKLEELRSQQTNLTKQYEELQRYYNEQQKQIEQQRSQNAELQQKVVQLRAENEDYLKYTQDLQKQLNCKDVEIVELKKTLTEKLNELELSQLRVKQLSNVEEEDKEHCSAKDHLIETLKQTQYMYEQQIRDLQAMVQQLNCDKEQANTQYQTYVQQLNTQQQQLNERNNELMEDIQRLQEREKQLIDHVQQLEKDIQKNIMRQAQYKEEQQQKVSNPNKNENNEEVQKLQERIQEYEIERHEFQLKIKSQGDNLADMKGKLEEKRHDIEQLQEQLARLTCEHPDKNKLLAVMESDKVAAARALTQNVELKQQLDELEKRFVQLTNDKAELMNRLDAEQYENRELQHNYMQVMEHLRNYNEKFKFKDEEMIRLSNENEQLKAENSSLLQQQAKKRQQQQQKIISLKQPMESQDHNHNSEKNVQQHIENTTQEIMMIEEHLHHQQQQENSHEHHHHTDKDNVTRQLCDTCDSAHEIKEEDTPLNSNTRIITVTPSVQSYTPTEGAVEKLQQRFTHLMSQVAELTDEKQRLEHLVLQLQGETETIGEYIALYQTQRRILKQREYERLAQAQLLRAERQQMHERLTLLNNLVNSLGVEFPPQTQHQQQQMAQADQMENLKQLDNQPFNQSKQNEHETVMAQSTTANNASTHPINQQQSSQNTTTSLQHVDEQSITLNVESRSLNTIESQQILHKIHDIISEIKENTKELPLSAMTNHNEDQLACCMGKFEVV